MGPTLQEIKISLNVPLSYMIVASSVAEPRHFYAAPAPGKNFDAVPAPAAPPPTLFYSKAKFLKQTKV
jgi:hypothetical protein